MNPAKEPFTCTEMKEEEGCDNGKGGRPRCYICGIYSMKQVCHLQFVHGCNIIYAEGKRRTVIFLGLGLHMDLTKTEYEKKM